MAIFFILLCVLVFAGVVLWVEERWYYDLHARDGEVVERRVLPEYSVGGLSVRGWPYPPPRHSLPEVGKRYFLDIKLKGLGIRFYEVDEQEFARYAGGGQLVSATVWQGRITGRVRVVDLIPLREPAKPPAE